MDTIADLIYKGINIKKENNFALSKIKKFFESFHKKIISLKKLDIELEKIKNENKHNITFMNHNKVIIYEKLKCIEKSDNINEEYNKEKIKKIKNLTNKLNNFLEKMSENRENVNNLLADLPKNELFEIIVKKELIYIKDIVFGTTFSNFKIYKKECLELFDKIFSFKNSQPKENYSEIEKEYLEYSDQFIEEHKKYLINIEILYEEIGLLLEKLIANHDIQCEKYKLFIENIHQFVEKLNSCEAKVSVFRKHKNLLLNLNLNNLKNYYKIFEDFNKNISDIASLEEENISLAKIYLEKFQDMKFIANGLGIKTILNKFMFLNDHLIVLNDKGREIKI